MNADESNRELLRLAPEEFALLSRYAWAVARKLSPSKRRVFDVVIARGGILSAADISGMVAKHAVSRWVRGLMEIAYEARLRVQKAQLAAPDIFPAGSGLGRFTP